MTDAERVLWRILRKRQLGGFRFRRQVPIDRYILDFVCLNPRVIVEVDGGQHSDNKIKQYDLQRTKWLKSHGYTVLRFWNNQVLSETGNVGEEILRNCLYLSSKPFIQKTSLPLVEEGIKKI